MSKLVNSPITGHCHAGRTVPSQTKAIIFVAAAARRLGKQLNMFANKLRETLWQQPYGVSTDRVAEGGEFTVPGWWVGIHCIEQKDFTMEE